MLVIQPKRASKIENMVIFSLSLTFYKKFKSVHYYINSFIICLIMKNLIALFALLISVQAINAQNLSSFDNIGKEESFVIKGKVSPDFGDMFKMAVTGYLNNKGVDIPVDENGNFLETVTFQGPIQEAYLYVDNTVTIPVAPGDTVIVDYTDKKLKLSSPNPENDRNLKFSKMRHDSMRKRFLNLNRAAHTAKTDSAKSALTDSINAYINDYNRLISDFEEANGALSQRNYFINDAYFSPLEFITNDANILKQITATTLDSNSKRPYLAVTGTDMAYPPIRDFNISYLRAAASEARSKIQSKEPSSYRSIKVVRAIAPDSITADIINAYQLRISTIFEPYAEIEKYAQTAIDNIQTEWIKDEISDIINIFKFTAPGTELPKLTLKDKDGNNISLDKFKGKVVLLDFWAIGCEPCLMEFSRMDEFKKVIADKADELQIITVCCHDPNLRNWQKIIDKYKLDDLNTILVPEESAEVYSNIAWPTYVLVGKDGKIFEWNTMRPSGVVQMKKHKMPTPIDKAFGN